jgi:putative flavoprotein involved in K+ transport
MLEPTLQSCPHHNVIIIGGGQAGLSVSWYLKQQGVEHVVFEKHGVAHAWKQERWDTFCLVTPNWQCRLPGYEYRGSDPCGFMLRDDIVEYIEGFAASFDPPLCCGVHVQSVKQEKNGVFHLLTSIGPFTAGQVVIATGSYQIPIIPRSAERLPNDILQIHSSNYRNPELLPQGSVLVVGSGQSGAQIAEDLHLAGRKTYLCVGEAPRVARVYRGKDVVEWLDLMGYYDLPVEQHPLREGVRDKTNHYVTGRDGGREIDLRLRALQGMELYGVMSDVRGDEIQMKPNLAKNLNDADSVNESIKASLDKFIAMNDFDAPLEERYEPLWSPSAERISLNYREANITSIVWCIGFHTDYCWIDLPVFNGRGAPVHHRGVTPVAGLYFIGLPWQHTWGSGRFAGIARDAEYISEQVRS